MKNLITSILIFAVIAGTYLTANSQQGGSLQNRTNENNLQFGIPEDIKELLDKFFESMVKREYKKGLENLLLNSPISKKDDDFGNILKQLSKAIEHYGEIKGYEIVDFKRAGTSYYRLKIIGLHQKFPTR
jgi:uncharacterized protein with von Willebrand factor type A (vWA) domain